jgi:hypothetical protein
VKKALAFALSLIGFNLQAATIIALFNGEQNPQNIQRFIVDDPTNPGWISTTTGIFTFTRSGGTFTGALNGTFSAFCIEPREFVSAGTTYTYDFNALEQGTTNIGGMGTVKANELRELFGRYYPVLGAALTSDQGSAMQIAVWEIVRETSATLNIHNGNVTFQNPANPAVDTTAMILAQTYLSSLDGTGPKLNNIYALTSGSLGVPGNQDLVVQVIASPEPATLVTMGAALIGLGLVLRKRFAV